MEYVTVDLDASLDFAQGIFGDAAIFADVRWLERVDGQHHFHVERFADFRFAVFTAVLADVSTWIIIIRYRIVINLIRFG